MGKLTTTRIRARVVTPLDTGSQELGWWLDDRERPAGEFSRPSDDAGAWRGPTDAAWLTRILHGAPPPRTSTSAGASAMVAHP